MKRVLLAVALVVVVLERDRCEHDDDQCQCQQGTLHWSPETQEVGQRWRQPLDDGSPQEEAHGQNRLAYREHAGQPRHTLSWHDQREPKE